MAADKKRADRERIAILGGGVGALCAAVALSEIDPKGEKYEITLYQLGWRLGGKCASGRNAAASTPASSAPRTSDQSEAADKDGAQSKGAAGPRQGGRCNKGIAKGVH